MAETGKKPWWTLRSWTANPAAVVGRIDFHLNPWPSSGNLLTEILLAPIQSRVSFALSLVHNSRGSYSSSFGSSSPWLLGILDEYLEEDGASGNVTHYDESGAEYLYTKVGSAYTSPAGLYTVLLKYGDGTFTITYKSGLRKHFNSGKRLVKISDRNGNAVLINRDGTQKMTSVQVQAVGGAPATVFDDIAYDGSNRLTRIGSTTYKGGWAFHFTINAGTGKLDGVTLPDGSTIGFAYTGDAITTLTDPRSNTWTFAYTLGRLTSWTDPAATPKTENIAYDTPASGKTTVTDRRGTGYDWIYTFNANGSVTGLLDPEGNEPKWEWNATSNLMTKYIDPRSTVPDPIETTYTWDTTRGNLIKITDPYGRETTMAYNALDLVIESTDPLNRKTKYQYDAKGNLVAVVTPTPATTTYLRNAQGDLIKVTDPEGWETEFEYDQAFGRQTAVTRVLVSSDGTCKRLTTRMEYDSLFQNVVRITDPDGNITDSFYDARQRLTESVRYLGASPVRHKFEYDANSNLTKQTGPCGNATTHTYDNLNRLSTTTDALARTVSYGYDAVGNLTSFTDAESKVWTKTYYKNSLLKESKDPMATPNVVTYFYDAAGNVTKITDARGYDTTMTYDKNSRLLTRTIPIDASTSATTTYAYDAAGQLVKVTDPENNVTTYEYDLEGRQTVVRMPLEVTTRTTYYRNGLVHTTTDANGNSTTRLYDTAGRLISVVDAAGNAETYTYSDGGLRLSVTDRRGNTTRFSYDGLGRLTSVTDALGNTTRYEYDLSGNQTLVVYPNGGKVERQYDAVGQLIAEHQFSTQDGVLRRFTTSYTYNSRGLVTEILHPNGRKDTFAYDNAGRKIQEVLDAGTGKLNYTTDYTLDANGNVVTVTKTDGGTTTYEYDRANRLIKVTPPVGEPTSYTLDKNGNITKIVYQASPEVSETFAYDGLGRRVTHTDRLGRVTRFYYDGGGNLTSLQMPDGSEIHQTFDAFGRVLRRLLVADPNNPALDRSLGFAYDPNGNMLSFTDFEGNTTRFEYDALNRVIRTTLPTGESATKSYDAVGNVSAEEDYNGNRTEYRYNEMNQVIAILYPDPAQNVTVKWCCCRISQYTDRLGTTTLKYDALHRLIEVTDALGHTVKYAYNGIGALTKVTDPNGDELQITVNAVGLPTRYKTTADNQETTITYTGRRKVASVTYPTTTNVVIEYSYDDADRVTQIKTTIGATVYTLDYSYKANTDLTAQWVYKQGVATLATDDFTYNALRLLTEEKVTSGGGATLFHRKYGYDTLLRRSKVEDPVSGWQSLFYYDAAGRLLRVIAAAGGGANPFPWPSGLTTVQSDKNGNILRMQGTNWWIAHEFDYEQRVTRVRASNGDIIVNEYDGMGTRLKELKTSAGSTTEKRMVYALGRVIQERDSSDAVTARYYWGLGDLMKRDTGSAARYMVSDLLRSPVDAFDNTGAKVSTDVYDAFGVRIGAISSGARPHPFAWIASYALSPSDLLLAPGGSPVFPQLGRGVEGMFRLTHLGEACPSAEGGCPEICGVMCQPEMPRVSPDPVWEACLGVWCCPQDKNCQPIGFPLGCKKIASVCGAEGLCICRGIRAAWGYYGCGQGPGYQPKPLPIPEDMPCACRDLLETPASTVGDLLGGLLSCCTRGFSRNPRYERCGPCCERKAQAPPPVDIGPIYDCPESGPPVVVYPFLPLLNRRCTTADAVVKIAIALCRACKRAQICFASDETDAYAQCFARWCKRPWWKPLLVYCGWCVGSGGGFNPGSGDVLYICDQALDSGCLEEILFHEMMHGCSPRGGLDFCAWERRAYGCQLRCYGDTGCVDLSEDVPVPYMPSWWRCPGGCKPHQCDCTSERLCPCG